jgi:dipeptidyl-peptidase 4
MRTRQFILLISLALAGTTTIAQDRLKSAPGYERAQQLGRESPTAVRGGNVAVTWIDDRAFEYTRDGKRFHFDVASRVAWEVPFIEAPRGGRGRGGEEPERGRQYESSASPDGTMKAFYRDRNVWISAPDGTHENAVTTDGSVSNRVKYGTASWVYGEELSQRTAMWWSPDSRKLAYYRFDEKLVPDYYVALDQTRLQSKVDTEAYPKAGVPNPIVDLFIYDVAAKTSTRVDVRSGQPFDNATVGHYVYHVEWSHDGTELLFFRTNRRQNAMEVAAANATTGSVRVVLREEWPTGWLNSEPRMLFLADGKRFVWESQRNGWNNFYLYDLSGRLLHPLTSATTYEAATLVKIDEAKGVVFYTARDGDNPLKVQLHRVGLDGTGDRRLTDPAFHHTIGGCIRNLGSRPEMPPVPAPCSISPENTTFVDVYQTHDTPPATRLVDASTGAPLADVAKSDTTKFEQLGLKKAEMFTYTAADGKTGLRGLVQFPSAFDPARKYPVLVSVYGGPEFNSNTARETFVTTSPLTEYGFLIVNLDSRAVPGLGKRVLDSLYLKLGQSEMDDMAEGVKALWTRSYVDKTRVGIYGTSYGGYSSLMELLRHPDVFAAASSSSPVTDWRNYDTIYTERYMWLPQENKEGYDAARAMTHARNLQGRLLLYYGTADNNVHPANSLQLIDALQGVGKSIDVQIGPDRGHSGVNQDRMMEFFIDALKP